MASLVLPGTRRLAHAEDSVFVSCQLEATAASEGFQLVLSVRNATDDMLGLEYNEGMMKVQQLAVSLSSGDAIWAVKPQWSWQGGPISRGIRSLEVALPPGTLVNLETFQCPWPDELVAQEEAFVAAEATVSVDFTVQLRVPTSRSLVHQVLASQVTTLVLPAEGILAL